MIGTKTTLLPIIDGAEYAGTEARYPVYDPSTGVEVAEVARCGAEEVDVAVRSAHAARRVWRDTKALDRARILHDIARALRENRESVAALESQSAGKLTSQALGDVEIAAQYFEFYGGLAPGLEGNTIGDQPTTMSMTFREPYGVTGHIIPWNFPLHTAARSIAPALAAGNTVVAKPAEHTPQTCLALATLAAGIGLPPGVFNVITGFGPEAGAPLTEHPLVRRLTFTGSVATGKAVLRAAAEHLCPATVELGGKSPVIVFGDSDIPAAVADASKAILTHSGQICSAGSRLLVADTVHDAVVDGLREQFDAARVGPADADVDLGPVASQEQRALIDSYIDAGLAEGANLQTSRQDVEGSGHFVRPALFTDVERDMRIATEEIFGPVLAVSSFSSFDDAVEQANASRFGLAAGVWTRDMSKAMHLARELEVGTVYINGYFAGGVELPFGGYKDSGFGREKGRAALEDYTQIKSVAVSMPRP